MESKARNALLNNRVKIMKFCNYFTVTGPMITRKILSTEQHKELKNTVDLNADSQQANTTRMDALLDFLDQCSVPGAFEAFVEGVKSCDNLKTFAKVLKKEAEGEPATSSYGIPFPGAGPPGPAKCQKRTSLEKSPKPKKPRTSAPGPGAGNIATTSTGGLVFLVPNGPAGPAPTSMGPPVPPNIVLPGQPPVTTKVKKPRAPKAKKGAVPPPTSAPVPIPVSSGPLPAGVGPQAGGVSGEGPKPEKGKGSGKSRAPAKKKQVNGEGLNVSIAGSGVPHSFPVDAILKKMSGAGKPSLKSAPKIKLPKGGASAAPTKIVAPGTGPTPAEVPPIAGPSGSNIGKVGGGGTGGFVAQVPAGSPFRSPQKASAKPKKMTFLEAEQKQKSALRAIEFSFFNPSAVVKTIHFCNKSDLFYEGCPYKDNKIVCAKKVQLKGKKKYVCKEKHENDSYQLFPRLYVSFEDSSSAAMQTTIFRENVEILAGKSASEIENMDVDALRAQFLKAIKQNIPITVRCKKVHKKDLKKAGGATWENVATIVTSGKGSGQPPAKKPRKSTSTD